MTRRPIAGGGTERRRRFYAYIHQRGLGFLILVVNERTTTLLGSMIRAAEQILERLRGRQTIGHSLPTNWSPIVATCTAFQIATLSINRSGLCGLGRSTRSNRETTNNSRTEVENAFAISAVDYFQQLQGMSVAKGCAHNANKLVPPQVLTRKLLSFTSHD